MQDQVLARLSQEEYRMVQSYRMMSETCKKTFLMLASACLANSTNTADNVVSIVKMISM